MTSFTRPEQDSLDKWWQGSADTLLNRDGDNPRFPGGGHRIKNDPLLIHAIEEIRDGYWQLFNQKRLLQKQHQNKEIPDSERNTVENIDYDLILWNKQSFERLQAPNYGLSPTEIAEVRQQHPAVEEMPGLSKGDATKITGTIIKRSIVSFEIALSNERHVTRPFVPHVPLPATPEQTGRRRHQPVDLSASPWSARTSSQSSETAPGTFIK